MQDQKGYFFKRREVVIIFLLLLVAGAVVFSLGIKLGQGIFCQAVQVNEDISLIKEVSEEEPSIDDTSINTTTPVQEAQKTNSVLGVKEITSDIKGKYTIQISSHPTEEEAKNIADKMYQDGEKLAYYMEAEIPGKGTWYRVGVGFFSQRSSAETLAEMLKKQGKINTYLIRKID